MSKQHQNAQETTQHEYSGRPAVVPLKSSGQVVVVHHATPPKGPADKQIHPRRPLPSIPAPSPESKQNKK
jgi:hypothetical protein